MVDIIVKPREVKVVNSYFITCCWSLHMPIRQTFLDSVGSSKAILAMWIKQVKSLLHANFPFILPLHHFNR